MNSATWLPATGLLQKASKASFMALWNRLALLKHWSTYCAAETEFLMSFESALPVLDIVISVPPAMPVLAEGSSREFLPPLQLACRTTLSNTRQHGSQSSVLDETCCTEAMPQWWLMQRRSRTAYLGTGRWGTLETGFV